MKLVASPIHQLSLLYFLFKTIVAVDVGASNDTQFGSTTMALAPTVLSESTQCPNQTDTTSAREAMLPLVIQSPKKEKAREGESVVLACHLTHMDGEPVTKNTSVLWYKESSEGRTDILLNNVTVSVNYNERIYLSGNWSQGDASLKIVNITLTDHGIYFCQVTLPRGLTLTGEGTKLRIRRKLAYLP
nr:PREDICTED: sodium channel subunit beta-3-like [Latimeria chalumnae]|eukprot:XP_014343247.1 PREDICTED: sodium channel subunit beta-3-like [Latimeria chalumnae]